MLLREGIGERRPVACADRRRAATGPAESSEIGCERDADGTARRLQRSSSGSTEPAASTVPAKPAKPLSPPGPTVSAPPAPVFDALAALLAPAGGLPFLSARAKRGRPPKPAPGKTLVDRQPADPADGFICVRRCIRLLGTDAASQYADERWRPPHASCVPDVLHSWRSAGTGRSSSLQPCAAEGALGSQ